MLRKLEADARLKQVEAERAEFKLITEKINYVLALEKKLPNGKARQAIRTRIEREVSVLLGSNDPAEIGPVSKRFLSGMDEEND